MKSYWSSWILAIIFVSITFLSTCTNEVAARRTRSSRHHKTKQYDAPHKPDELPTTTLTSNNANEPVETSTMAPQSEKIRMELYDVCQGWWCGHGRECQRGSDGLPSCICIRECPGSKPSKESNREETVNKNNDSHRNGYLEYGKGFEEFYEPFPDSELIFPTDTVAPQQRASGVENKPVCGSDGKIYPNQCELYRTACITNHPYLHVDDSEESCRHVAHDEGKEAIPSYPSYGGKPSKGNPGESNNHDQSPFGEGSPFLVPGGDFPAFPPFGSNGDVPFGHDDFNPPGHNFNPDKRPVGSGSNAGSGSHGKGGEKEKNNEHGKSHGKLASKNTGFGSGAEAAAVAAGVLPRKRDSSLSPFQQTVSFKTDEVESESDDEDEDDDDSDDDEDDDDYSSELGSYSFISNMEASLFGESGREKGSSTNIPRNSDKAIRKVENDVRKNRRVIKRKMTEESVKSSASIQQPSESRWEVISRGKTGWTQNRNNLASDQKKTTTKWDKDIEKVEWNKMSASQDLKEFTPSTARLASPGDLQSNRKTLFGAARRGSSLCSREEYEILKDALLIYNHDHLIGESRVKKGLGRKSDEGKGFSDKYRESDSEEGEDESEESEEEESSVEEETQVVENARRSSLLRGQRADESTFQKEYLLSLMFAHFDQNNNGKLDYAELQKIGMEQNIKRPATIHCHLVDFLRFDDMDHDSLISPNEFYTAFSNPYSTSILGEGKPRSPIHLTARVGETLEIKCSVGAGSVSALAGQQHQRKLTRGSNLNDNELDYSDRGETADPQKDRLPQLPTTQWYRYGVDVSKLINLGEQFQIHKDGTLIINRVELIHAGNYSCHDDSGKEKVTQPYILSVQMLPEVKVRPRLKWERPGEDVEMECRAQGEPLPAVRWLKNDNLVVPSQNKYSITGEGITLKVKDINFSDTGAYMCQAQNAAGKRIEISSLVVIDEQVLPPAQSNESQFLVFHDRGISTYDPENCRLQHQILATDIIPGTQRDYICGSSIPSACEWGRAIRVSSVYVYVSQPRQSRVLIISISEMVVVDVVSTDRYPVELHYVPQVDQVWIECWKQEEPYSSKTLQVIRGAMQKKKHRAVRPKPLVSLEADLVQNVFLPRHHSPFDQTSDHPSGSFWHAYISHKNTRGLYKMDLRTLRYTKSIDLTSYNCLPEQVHFTALYGFIILECKEPVLHQPTGQLVLDSISDAIIAYKADLNGASFLSPDGRKLVTILQNRHDHSGGTTLLLQHVEANGLRIAFDVNTSLNISDAAFFPSQRFHSYDLYATAVDKEDILFVDLHSGDVELVPGVGRALQNPSWERAQRPIVGEDVFGKYLVTPSSDAVYVVNGRSHTVNCQIGGMTKPTMGVWL